MLWSLCFLDDWYRRHVCKGRLSQFWCRERQHKILLHFSCRLSDIMYGADRDNRSTTTLSALVQSIQNDLEKIMFTCLFLRRRIMHLLVFFVIFLIIFLVGFQAWLNPRVCLTMRVSSWLSLKTPFANKSAYTMMLTIRNTLNYTLDSNIYIS